MFSSSEYAYVGLSDGLKNRYLEVSSVDTQRKKKTFIRCEHKQRSKLFMCSQSFFFFFAYQHSNFIFPQNNAQPGV